MCWSMCVLVSPLHCTPILITYFSFLLSFSLSLFAAFFLSYFFPSFLFSYETIIEDLLWGRVDKNLWCMICFFSNFVVRTSHCPCDKLKLKQFRIYCTHKLKSFPKNISSRLFIFFIFIFIFILFFWYWYITLYEYSMDRSHLSTIWRKMPCTVCGQVRWDNYSIPAGKETRTFSTFDRCVQLQLTG